MATWALHAETMGTAAKRAAEFLVDEEVEVVEEMPSDICSAVAACETEGGGGWPFFLSQESRAARNGAGGTGLPVMMAVTVASLAVAIAALVKMNRLERRLAPLLQDAAQAPASQLM